MNYPMRDTSPDIWLNSMEQHTQDIIDSLRGTLTFREMKTVVSRVQTMIGETTAADGPSTREKIVAVVGYIIDHTDTPWLDDDMSDPFMKAMVPSLVDYMLDTSTPVDGSGDCFWERCGSALFRC